MKKILTIIALVFSGATGWLLLEPTLSDDTVNDTPVVIQENTAQQNHGDTTENQDGEATAKNKADQPLTPDSQAEQNETAVITDRQLDVQTESAITHETSQQGLSKTSDTTELKPQLLSGSFTNGKARYRATGDVFISGQDLSLVNLDSTNVPDGFVYLSNDLQANDAVRIAKLQGNIGNQNYTIPEQANASDYKYVLIWCRAFSSLIGYAEIN